MSPRKANCMLVRPGSRRSFGLLTLLFLNPIAFPIHAAEDFVYHHENVMGTSLECHVKADSLAAATWAEKTILEEIDRLSLIFSGYDQASAFSRWSAQPNISIKVDPELLEVLHASDEWSQRSGGAFDPRVETLTQLWVRSAKANRVPSSSEIEQALTTMHPAAWKLDVKAGTAERLTSCPITLNAIAKGDIVERVTQLALDTSRGVRGVCLNVGGDMRVAGDLTQVVGIASPRSDSESSEPLVHINLRDKAISTSGRSQRGLTIQGKWFSHIFDPRTGKPASGIALATIIAANSRDADALATICNVLSPAESLKLINTLPNVDAMIVTTDGHVVKSRNWLRHEHTVATPLALNLTPLDAIEPKPVKANHWGDDHEVAIDFAIAQPEPTKARGGYRRPYLAVWVEDSKGLPVRTLNLWIGMGGSGPDRWLDDLRRWYRPDEIKTLIEKKNMVYATARPTRPPGKYTVIWDGKDDAGKPLPTGTYVIYLESAREHGPYSITHKAITVGDTLFDEEIQPNVELTTARVSYRGKAPAK